MVCHPHPPIRNEGTLKHGLDTVRIASKKLEDENAKQNEALNLQKGELEAAEKRLIKHQKILAAHERDMAEAQKKIPQGLRHAPFSIPPSPVSVPVPNPPPSFPARIIDSHLLTLLQSLQAGKQ